MKIGAVVVLALVMILGIRWFASSMAAQDDAMLVRAGVVLPGVRQ